MQDNINENIEKLVQKSRNIDEILSKNDLVGDFTTIQKELSIDRPEVLKNALEEKQNTNRDLNLAIIGAVKAGKSSFINALMFDGKSVLPKAATPMTAALSVLEFSDNFEAIVEFYTEKDRVEIKAKYEAAKQTLKDLETRHIQSLAERLKDTKTEEQIRETAKINALRDFKKNTTLYAYYDQYDRMQKSSTEPQGDTRSIQASSIKELVGNIEEYVGANGKYMPFTKSIILRFKDERLKGIRIVDTPGVNDPISSREQRTEEYLAKCDAVLFLSSAGQLLDGGELDLLERINTKNAIQECFVIATQADLQLYASEKVGTDLDASLKQLQASLNQSVQTAFMPKPQDSKTLQELYAKFRNNGVVLNSAICVNILNGIKGKEEEFYQNKLQEEFPDYFTPSNTEANLKKIANFEKAKEIVSLVRERKEETLQAQLKEFYNVKKSALESYQQEIQDNISIRLEKLKSQDLDEVKTQIAALKKAQESIENSANDAYEDSIVELSQELKSRLKANVAEFFKDISQAQDNAQGSETRTHTETIDKGMGFLFWRSITGTRYEEKTYTKEHKTLNATTIRRALENALSEINDILDNAYSGEIIKWRNKIRKDLVNALRESTSDEYLEAEQIRSAVRSVMASINMPTLDFDSTLPSTLKQSGILSDSEIDSYQRAVDDFVGNLRSNTNRNIESMANYLKDTLMKHKVGSQLVSRCIEEQENLVKDLEHKEENIAHYEEILSQIGTC